MNFLYSPSFEQTFKRVYCTERQKSLQLEQMYGTLRVFAVEQLYGTLTVVAVGASVCKVESLQSKQLSVVVSQDGQRSKRFALGLTHCAPWSWLWQTSKSSSIEGPSLAFYSSKSCKLSPQPFDFLSPSFESPHSGLSFGSPSIVSLPS